MEMASVLVANTDPTASRQMRELERALGQLPLEQREAILLVGLEGLRYDEAATVACVPIGTVRSRLSRGREALRQILGIDDIGTETAPAPAEERRGAARVRVVPVGQGGAPVKTVREAA
jgi:hypothetical protein